MRYGLRIPSFALGPNTPTLEAMGRYLRRAEDLKFEAAVTIDHLLLTPPAYATTWLEPLSMLSALAGVTRTIRLGTMVNDQLLHSADQIADFWYTAWVDAGKPDLDVLLSTPLTKKDKKDCRMEFKAYRKDQLIEKHLLLARKQPGWE